MVLFVYGSLMAEEGVKILIGRVPKSMPAVLAHYGPAIPVAGACFPAIAGARWRCRSKAGCSTASARAI